MADKFIQAIIDMQEKEAIAMAQQMLDSGNRRWRYWTSAGRQWTV